MSTFTPPPPSPFRLGVSAYGDGIARDACPTCFHGRDAMAWLAGWDIGERMEQQYRIERAALIIGGRPA